MANQNDFNRRLLIVSGLSGAGKSLVLNTLEDQGFFCIDNLPIQLFHEFSKLLVQTDNGFPYKVGIGIDSRSPEEALSLLPAVIKNLKDQGVDTELMFLEANKEILTARFSETRRKHPLSSGDVALSDAIDKDKEVLTTLSEIADIKIDSSFTTVHELRDLIRERVANRETSSMSIQFTSFGFKHGVPHDSDFLFDVRCLTNPHWEKNLRSHSGKDTPVIEFLQAQEDVNLMVKDLQNFLSQWIPQFEKENRSYLSISIGCTGGHHRSVFIVEKLARYFEDLKHQVVIRHRDL